MDAAARATGPGAPAAPVGVASASVAATAPEAPEAPTWHAPAGGSPTWAASRPWLSGLLAGALLVTGFAPYGQWWLTPPLGVAVLALTVHGRSPGRGAVLGLVAGLAFFVPLLSWIRLVGDDAWLALAAAEALVLAGLGAALAAVSRLRRWPLWSACLWVTCEALRDRWPFGGFPWGRLGYTQAGAPAAGWAALGGVPLVTFVVALAGGLLAAAWLARPRRRADRVGPAGLLLAGAVAVLVAGAAVPTPGAGQAVGGPAHAVVALVQGNVPRLGLDPGAQRAAVLGNHVRATLDLADHVRAGQVPAPAAVFWPENSSDLDPYRNAQAAQAISVAADAVGAPILVGAVVEAANPNQVLNVGIVWHPGTGPGQVYIKQHPVPFTEYIPFRSVLTRFVGRFRLIPRDFAAGHRTGVLDVGPVRIGNLICFEVAEDGLVRAAVRGGGRAIVVQTNNATFGRSGETRQQLAMSRIRAVEHGRTVLVVATSGISAVVRPDGGIEASTAVFTAANLVRDVPLRDGRTVADRLGSGPEWVLAGLGAVALVAGLAAARRRRGSRT